MNKIKKSRDVYWSSHNANGLLIEAPEVLLKDLSEQEAFFGEEPSMYSKCPGYAAFFKNTFIVRAPVDLKLRYEVNGEVHIYVEGEDQDFYDRHVTIKKYSTQQQIIHLNWHRYLFSESDLEVSQIHPFYHKNGLSDHYVATGTYNISKWIRPIYPNITLTSNELNIKRGDVLYYLKFHTDDKINLKQFKKTDIIEELKEDCIGVKAECPGLRLKALYSLFDKKNYNKKIMKEIKNNLIK